MFIALPQGYSGVKPGWTRVSFPYYMSEEDFEYILSAIEFVAVYGQRFFPLYNFDLRNGSWRIKTENFEALNKEDIKQSLAVRRNQSYFDVARYIASSLPKFPPQGALQGDMDPNTLCFRVWILIICEYLIYI